MAVAAYLQHGRAFLALNNNISQYLLDAYNMDWINKILLLF